MICDTRLVDKPYGRRIWQSLPPFKRTREADVVREFFARGRAANQEPDLDQDQD
jgi:ATP-dependent DNA helicase DinG